MKIDNNEYLDFSEVLLKPKRSTLASRKDALLERTFNLPYFKHTLRGTPIMSSNMTTVSTVEATKVITSDEYSMYSCLHKYMTPEQHKELFNSTPNIDLMFYTIGLSEDDFAAYLKLTKEIGYYPNLCIDAANGYTERFVEFVASARDAIQDKAPIMVGNVVTPEITEELILRGADIVKCGIGSGSHCLTRNVAGVGVPQFTAVLECAEAAHGVSGLLCSDGGILCPGDVVKAFGAGADFVMIGSEFAAHTENSETIDNFEVEVYGMSSVTAMDKYNGGMNTYRASEGRTTIVPFRGHLKNTLDYYLGGLRSGMTYIGAQTMKDIPKRASFVKVRNTHSMAYEKYSR